MKRLLGALLLLGGLAVVASSQEEDNVSYAEALERAVRRGSVVRGSQAEKKAIERFEGFISALSADSVRARALEVYARDAYFDDTLVHLSGGEAIARYLEESLGGAEEVRVQVEDVAVSGANYYFRWTMLIRFKKLYDSQPTRSQGMSHIRFDPEGRVLLHRDFWDAAGGFFEYVPVLGRLIRLVRGRL